MFNYNVGILLVLVLLMTACTPVKEKDLYGTYIAEYSFGYEKVTLSANGEYIQEVSIKGESRVLTHKGHWWYEPKYKYIRLEYGLIIEDSDSGSEHYYVPFDGDVLMKVRRVFPSIRLGTAYEDVDFVKM
ncbi:MAG: hypothetical protein HZB85_05080 [Deltaproteobacteria bacterium]|nr:hypothetical protein [Deltaproteobacteria bacterium]